MKTIIKRIAKIIFDRCRRLFSFPIGISPNDARSILSEYSSEPLGTCVGKNIMDVRYDLHIIIPAYNAEKYIIECLDSIFSQQTKYTFLVSVVNDGSTDQTDTILKSYAENLDSIHGTMEIITQENRGLSEARNAALRQIRGRYVMFIDADDVLCSGAIDALLRYDCDIVQGSYYEFAEGYSKNVSVNRTTGFAWGKVFRAECLKDFQFPSHYLYEDTPLSFLLYEMFQDCMTIGDIVYGYRKHNNSISSTSPRQRRIIETYYVTELCLKEMKSFGVNPSERMYNHFLRQCIMNYGRCRHCPRKVQKAVFVLECELMQRYFGNFSTDEADLQYIEEALRKKHFNCFEIEIRVS